MSRSRPRGRGSLFVPPVANLKTASPLALDDDLAVQRTQFDLADVTASGIDFLSDQRCALKATARSALRNEFAAVNTNFCRCGVEVRLKHTPGTAQIPQLASCRQAHYDAATGNLTVRGFSDGRNRDLERQRRVRVF